MPELLKIKEKSACRFDLIALGEVMLRLDPGASHVHTARSFDVWEGGGEYNEVLRWIAEVDLVDVQAIRDGKASVVTERAREFVRIVKQARSQDPPT
jgi:hypothetical protein